MTNPSFRTEDIPRIIFDLDRASFDEADETRKDRFLTFLRDLTDTEWLVRGDGPVKDTFFIDLEELSSFADYVSQCRKIHKGNAVRDALKAVRAGYYAKFFNASNYLGDILEISLSMPERQGQRLPDHYFLTPEESGGYPATLEPEEIPTDALAWSRYFGLFQRKPGHCQGHLQVGEKLLAYGILRRCGPLVLLTKCIGHGDYLQNGIMYKMHMDMVETFIKHRDLCKAADQDADYSLRGLRYILNSRYSNAAPGLAQWKIRMLYRPGFFQYDFEPDLLRNGAASASAPSRAADEAPAEPAP